MNTTHGEWVRCTKCIYVKDCDTKEDRDGCYFGEIDEEYNEKTKDILGENK